MKGSDRFFVDGVVCRIHGTALRVANLSVGGMFVATELPLIAGQIVEVELVLKDRPPFAALARVSWVNEPPHLKAPDLPHGAGIQITRIGMADKLALVDFLKRTPPDALRDRHRV
jgi:PilZ domain-containing protein